MNRKVDVAIIGAGTAGMSAYREAKKYAEQVVLIEGGNYGTTCARVGCMPSKLLIAAAESAYAIQQAPGFGVHAASIRIDGKQVMARVKSERDRFVGFVIDSVENFPEADRIRGYARFKDAHHLEIDNGVQVEAKSIVIATGSSPFVPPILSDLGERLLLNDDIFELNDLPKSVAVFGAGVIGLELGQALHHLGVKIQLFGVRHNVGGIQDPVIQEKAIEIFQSEFAFQPDARVQSVTRVEGGVEITWLDTRDQIQSEIYEYALAAAGRRPNLAKLGLDALGVELDQAGLPPFDSDTLQISDLPVFLAGDVNNVMPLLHEAADDGKIAGFNAAHYPDIKAGQRRSKLGIVFSHPQIAGIGTTYKYLDPNQIVIGQVSFENQGRSRVMLENKGMLRVYADKATGKFIGAEMLGPRAENIAHLLAWAHQQEMSIEQMLGMPFYHPVIEEGLRTALQDAARQLKKQK